jgi:hypothetical protein
MFFSGCTTGSLSSSAQLANIMTSQNVKEETLILPECKNQYETWYEYHAI